MQAIKLFAAKMNNNSNSSVNSELLYHFSLYEHSAWHLSHIVSSNPLNNPAR